MQRRELILGAGAILCPVRLHAQQRALPVIGFLNSASPGPWADLVAAFHAGLKESGFTEGQNVAMEYRWAENHYDRLPALAADLVSRKVNVLATSGGDRSAVAAKNATSTIPIVSVIGGDPVADGLVASLARPGGNLTGVSFLTAALTNKRLEMLSELVPQAKVIALLVNPKNPQTAGVVKDVKEPMIAKGLEFHSLEAETEGDIDEAFSMLDRLHAGALVVESDPFFNSRGAQFVSLASRYAVPAIYERREFVTAGGLISYGTSLTGVYRLVGIDVGKILKGAKPADLPVEQPTKFDLVINLKTAQDLGLIVPPILLARADEVIE